MEKRNPKPLKPITDYATAILARREHSTTELRRKLTTKGYPKPEVADLITLFLEKNYLNDERYAEARARTRAHHSKWGEGRIKQELAQQGVAKETTQKTLSELSETEDWLATATKLLQRKFTKPLPEITSQNPALRQQARKELQAEKSRRLNFLIRRGFSFQQAQQALGLSQEDLDDTFEE
jgi:regulatory protein